MHTILALATRLPNVLLSGFAGLVHLLPHCQESQARLQHVIGDYPLYLVLITLGYLLVLFVERVLFDVHGAEHGHGSHTGIVAATHSSHSVHHHSSSSHHQQQHSDMDDHAHDNRTDHRQANANIASARTAVGASNTSNRNEAAGGNESNVCVDNAPATLAAAVDSSSLHEPLLSAARAANGEAGLPAQQAEPCGVHQHEQHQHQHQHHHHDHNHGVPGSPANLRQGLVLLVAMSVHTFLECMALGLLVSAAGHLSTLCLESMYGLVNLYQRTLVLPCESSMPRIPTAHNACNAPCAWCRTGGVGC